MHPYKKALLCTAGCLAMSMTLAAFSPANALFSSKSRSGDPALHAFSKSAPAGTAVCFSKTDFEAESGSLSGVIVTSLPRAGSGSLTRGGVPVSSGSVIPAESLGSLAFVPADGQAEIHTSFEVTPVFAGVGAAGQAVTVSLHLSDRQGSAPIARSAALETYCGLQLAGCLQAVDPDGDELTYTLSRAPASGTVTVEPDGSFIYTPTGSKAGTDSFTFTAADPGGLQSEAAVTVTLHTRGDSFCYADMAADPNHYAAVRLAELDILRGEQIGGVSFLYPETPVTRAQFVAMAARLCRLTVPTAAVSTGMADNDAVPAWARAAMAAAIDSALITGEQQDSGNRVVRAGDPITRAEAAVILNRMLALSDDGRTPGYADAGILPTWAAQAVVNTVEAGYLTLDADGSFSPSRPLTRAEAAGCLYRASQAMADSGRDFWDIF